tara:strand:- start:1608 stop:1787 length:180 start_codon:yes stop_codon:yes gene_type:complete
MQSIQSGQNICISFTDDELQLKEEFRKFCKRNYTSQSGWVKKSIHDAIQNESQKQYAFR